MEIEGLKLHCSFATVMPEGGVQFILLPKLRFWSNDSVLEMDVLLCPQAHTGYQTRLFLERPIAGKGANWTTHYILGRSWFTWSWNNVPANLPLIEILANHLGALR